MSDLSQMSDEQILALLNKSKPEGMLERGAMALNEGMNALQDAPYVGGVFRGFRNTAQGIAQGVAKIGEAAGVIDPETVREYEQISGDSRAQFKQSHPGFNAGEMVGDVASTLALGPNRAATGILDAAKLGAMGGAVYGATRPVDDPDYWSRKAKDTALAGASGAAGGAAVQGVAGIIAPKVNDAARRLLDEGVHLTPGQMKGGMLQRLEQGANSTPVIGGVFRGAQTRAVEDMNRAAANRALKPLGETLPDNIKPGRDMVDYLSKRLGQSYDEIIPQLSAQADDVYRQELTGIADELGTLFPDQKATLIRILGRRLGDRGSDDFLDGKALKTITEELGKDAAKFKGSAEPGQRELANALMDVKDVLMRTAERTNPNNPAIKALKATNEGYANFKRVERAAGAQGSEGGVFSAEQLRAAVKALDRSKDKGAFSRGGALMSDFADDAVSTLGRKVPDSGTPERAGIIGALLGGATYVEPTTALAAVLAAGPYTKAGQKAMEVLIAKRPESAYMLADLLRKAGPVAGPAGAYQALE